MSTETSASTPRGSARGDDLILDMPAPIFWRRSLLGMAMLFLVLSCVTTAYTFVNRGIRADLNERQVYLQQSIELQRIDQSLIRALAIASVKDLGIKKMLADNGLNVQIRQNPKAATTPAGSGGGNGKEQ